MVPLAFGRIWLPCPSVEADPDAPASRQILAWRCSRQPCKHQRAIGERNSGFELHLPNTLGKSGPEQCRTIQLPRHAPSTKFAVNDSNRVATTMAILTVRNLPDDVHRALRLRAAQHGRSTEGEVRAILAEAVKAPGPQRMGDALTALGREVGLTDEDLNAMDEARQRRPAVPVDLE